MQDLTPVGLSRDGTKLVLVSASGEEFAVPVDTRLRAAVRGDTTRLGQLEMKMESALRPRDIQARIRAGESPEDVAAAAQTTVEAIMGFATPVLAERAHVARQALSASIRRSGDAPSVARTLGDAAEAFLADRGLHEQDVDWDAWRRQDGRWALVARYDLEGRSRTAEFAHDLPGRYVVAENDEARTLTGELSSPGTPGIATGVGSRRLSSVPSQDELPLGDDAIELVRERAERDSENGTDTADTEDTEALPTVTADADWMTTQRPAPVDQQLPRQESEQESAPAGDQTSDQTGDHAGDQEPPAAPRKKGRSSVPSWEDIMFGGGKTD